MEASKVTKQRNGSHHWVAKVDRVFVSHRNGHTRIYNMCQLTGGGYFAAYEDIGRMLDRYSPPAIFSFFAVEIRSHTLIPLIRPGSASPQWLSELVGLRPSVP